MKVLVVHGSERGGTAEIADWIAVELRGAGLDVDVRAARSAAEVRPYDAVIVGGALYMGRWQRDARRFVRRRRRELRGVPVWMFSSGPLDETAVQRAIPPSRSVTRAMEWADAQGHATFGGRLKPDARGRVASAIAKDRAGDHRDRGQVREWARGISEELAAGREGKDDPGAAIRHHHGRPSEAKKTGHAQAPNAGAGLAPVPRRFPDAGW